MLVDELAYREWRTYLQEPKSCVVLGFLSCAPCQQLKAMIATIEEREVGDWRFASCAVPGSKMAELVAEERYPGVPILVANNGRRLIKLYGYIADRPDESRRKIIHALKTGFGQILISGPNGVRVMDETPSAGEES